MMRSSSWKRFSYSAHLTFSGNLFRLVGFVHFLINARLIADRSLFCDVQNRIQLLKANQLQPVSNTSTRHPAHSHWIISSHGIPIRNVQHWAGRTVPDRGNDSCLAGLCGSSSIAAAYPFDHRGCNGRCWYLRVDPCDP